MTWSTAAVSYCRAELDRQGVDVQLRIARDLPPVSVDAVQIEQVMINLVRNSAEALAMPDGTMAGSW